MCRHRRQGLGRGARPGLRGSPFLMPRYNPFFCSSFLSVLLHMGCFSSQPGPCPPFPVSFPFPLLVPILFSFPLSTCDLFNLHHFYLSGHLISQLTEHLLYARHCSQHWGEDENRAERSHTSKTDMVGSRWWERLPSRKQRGKYGISGGERCQKEDKLDNVTESDGGKGSTVLASLFKEGFFFFFFEKVTCTSDLNAEKEVAMWRFGWRYDTCRGPEAARSLLYLRQEGGQCGWSLVSLGYRGRRWSCRSYNLYGRVGVDSGWVRNLNRWVVR